MNKLNRLDVTPPGGWWYVDPDTGLVFPSDEHRSFSELAEHVKRYRDQNNLPVIQDLEDDIQDFLCSHCPDPERYCQQGAKPRTPSQYVRGTIAAIKILTRQAPFAHQWIAEKRAAICVKCPHNKFSSRHSRAREYTDRKIRDFVGRRKTTHDAQLFSCELCSCPLRPKVHIAQDIIEESLSKKERAKLPDFCWQAHPVTKD